MSESANKEARDALLGQSDAGSAFRKGGSKRIRPRRVFVVDDEPSIACSLAEILSLQGHEVLHFSDPRNALTALRTQSPDLLITDIHMPPMCGMDLAFIVLSMWPRSPVLFLSATADRMEIEGRFGSTEHIRTRMKPCNPLVLIADVEELLALTQSEWKASSTR
jgi:DNA-binding response OmpR family regulator